MAPQSSILAWRISWTKPDELQSSGSQRLGRDWSDRVQSHKGGKKCRGGRDLRIESFLKTTFKGGREKVMNKDKEVRLV